MYDTDNSVRILRNVLYKFSLRSKLFIIKSLRIWTWFWQKTRDLKWKFVKSFRMNSYRIQFMFYGPEAQRHLISLSRYTRDFPGDADKEKIAQKISAGQIRENIIKFKFEEQIMLRAHLNNCCIKGDCDLNSLLIFLI